MNPKMLGGLWPCGLRVPEDLADRRAPADFECLRLPDDLTGLRFPTDFTILRRLVRARRFASGGVCGGVEREDGPDERVGTRAIPATLSSSSAA